MPQFQVSGSSQSKFWQHGQYFRTYWDFILNELNPGWSRTHPKAKLVDIIAQTPDANTYVLKVPRQWRGFTAGMHLPISVEINGLLLHRTYTISSTPAEFEQQGTVAFTAKRIPNGRVSNHLFDHAQLGQWLRIGNASGAFILSATPAKRLAFFAGGSGITPFFSMLNDHLANSGPKRQISLLYYCQNERDVIFANRLRNLAEKHDHFELNILLADQHDLINQTQIESLCPDIAERDAFLCGPQGFMDAASTALASIGLPEQRIFRESFGARLSAEALQAMTSGGQVSFKRSNIVVEGDGQHTLLELAEASGLTPKHGCRAGICHQCKCTKVSGRVIDVRNGRASSFEQEEIQVCVSVPNGPVEIAL